MKSYTKTPPQRRKKPFSLRTNVKAGVRCTAPKDEGFFPDQPQGISFDNE